MDLFWCDLDNYSLRMFLTTQYLSWFGSCKIQSYMIRRSDDSRFYVQFIFSFRHCILRCNEHCDLHQAYEPDPYTGQGLGFPSGTLCHSLMKVKQEESPWSLLLHTFTKVKRGKISIAIIVTPLEEPDRERSLFPNRLFFGFVRNRYQVDCVYGNFP
jgi:hypothetical protein